MVLLLAKMVAVALDEVSLSAEFLHSLLGCGAAALAEPRQSGTGSLRPTGRTWTRSWN